MYWFRFIACLSTTGSRWLTTLPSFKDAFIIYDNTCACQNYWRKNEVSYWNFPVQQMNKWTSSQNTKFLHLSMHADLRMFVQHHVFDLLLFIFTFLNRIALKNPVDTGFELQMDHIALLNVNLLIGPASSPVSLDGNLDTRLPLSRLHSILSDPAAVRLMERCRNCACRQQAWTCGWN